MKLNELLRELLSMGGTQLHLLVQNAPDAPGQIYFMVGNHKEAARDVSAPSVISLMEEAVSVAGQDPGKLDAFQTGEFDCDIAGTRRKVSVTVEPPYRTRHLVLSL